MPAEGPLKYLVQLVSTTAEQEVVYSPPVVCEANFTSSRFREPSRFLWTQGVVPNADGGFLLTTAATREAAAGPAGETRDDFPQPRPVSRSYAGTLQATKADRVKRAARGVWTEDAAAFITAEPSANIVRKLAVPEFNALVEIDRKAPITALAMASGKLLVLTGDETRLWALDPVTLEVQWMRTAARGTLAASPRCPWAFIARLAREGRLEMLDAATGKILHVCGAGLQDPVVSPAGDYLFARANDGMVRIRIDGDNLILEQATPAIRPTGTAISTDGKLLAAKTEPRFRLDDDHPVGRSIYIYDSADLSKPKSVVRARDTNPTIFAATPSRVFSLWYDYSSDLGQIDVYSPSGEPLHSLRKLRSRYICAHPDGKRLLSQYTNQFAWVPLPEHVTDAAAEPVDDSIEIGKRLANRLGWETVTHDEIRLRSSWQQLGGGARAAKLLLAHADPNSYAWGKDGKCLYLREEQQISRFNLETVGVSHTLTIPDHPWDSDDQRRLSCSAQGLIVRDRKRVVLVDAENLLPKRILFEDIPTSERILGAPASDYVFRGRHVHKVRREVATVDLRNGKTLDMWEMPDKEANARALGVTEFVAASPDGRHLFFPGRPALHLGVDESGKIKKFPAVVQAAEGAVAMPQPLSNSAAVTFQLLGSQVRSFICNITDGTKLVAASRTSQHWAYDPTSRLYWNVAAPDLVAYDVHQGPREPLSALRVASAAPV